MNQYVSETKNIETYSSPSLAVGIPAGRSIDWTARLLSKLDKLDNEVEVLIARSSENRLRDQQLDYLNSICPIKEVISELGHAPAMRNAIIKATVSSHILFLDDDMVPGPDILARSIVLATEEPNVVHQGIPYRVANSDNWFARNEGTLYERGYKKYISEDDTVSLLDARLMLAPAKVLRETPFDESLVLGAGEGRELARNLIEKSVILRLARQLDAAHINRDSIASLTKQKQAHGRSLGYLILNNGPGEMGWLNFYAAYGKRHFILPAVQRTKGAITTEELVYTWSTNTVLWSSALEYMLRSSLASK